MALYLLDNSLKVEVFFDSQDCDYEDNVCVRFIEDCPEEEKIFWAGETNMYLTHEQARQLAQSLLEAADASTRGPEEEKH